MCITAKLIVEWQRLGPFSPDLHAPDALGMSASLRSLPKFGTRASLNRRFLMLLRSSSSGPQAASSLFTGVDGGPQAASIGVPASSSLLKKFWGGTRRSRLSFQEGA